MIEIAKGLTKAELGRWAEGLSRTPATVLKAFIDAGLCSDQSPAREETRLFRLAHTDAQMAAPDADKGPWEAGVADDGRVFLQSDDFTHDVRLYIDGDFRDQAERWKYAQSILASLSASNAMRDALEDPNAVHVNMLRGSIAKPSIAQIIHIYGKDAILAALAGQGTTLDRQTVEHCAKIAERKYEAHGFTLATDRARNFEHAGKRIAAAIRASMDLNHVR